MCPEQGELVGPFALQTRGPLLCLPSQLRRRLQGQPLLQRYVRSEQERWKPEKIFAHYAVFLWHYLKTTVPALRRRKQKRTTSSSRRPPALRRSPGPGSRCQRLPVTLRRPPPSPPQRTGRRMKWSTHSRCVSCCLTVYSRSSFSKVAVRDLVFQGWEVHTVGGGGVLYRTRATEKRNFGLKEEYEGLFVWCWTSNNG